jgi:hypothetical protein
MISLANSWKQKANSLYWCEGEGKLMQSILVQLLMNKELLLIYEIASFAIGIILLYVTEKTQIYYEKQDSCIDSIMLRRLAGRQSKAACTGRRQHDTPAAD